MDQPEKILVVEDEPLQRRSLRAYLESVGFQVIEAKSGEEGLEIGLREHPDLVLLDINLPGMNGFETCRSLKALPELSDTPVIFLSVLTDTSNLLEAFSSGGVDYVSKPFLFSEIKARVLMHLELRKRRRQVADSQKNLQDALAEVREEQRFLIKVNERLRQSEKTKSHFIDHMRNEINDPLGAILGLADEICDPRLPGELVRALANRIKAEAFHLDFQFRNIFCAAELEAGEASLSVAMVDVESVLRDVVTAFAAGAQEKGQTLEVHVAQGIGPFPTDAEKLRIILANLLANAIEFSPKGGRIDLRAFPQSEAMVIEVEDDGGGLSEEDVSIIFERFRQLDSGTSRAHKGQGLGLAVVKALVELQDGQILVDTEPGHGSTFTCRLPLRPQTGNPDTFAFDGNLFIFDEPHES